MRDGRESSDSFREIHASQQVLEAGGRAQIVNPEVGSQEVRQVGGFFLVGPWLLGRGLLYRHFGFQILRFSM